MAATHLLSLYNLHFVGDRINKAGASLRVNYYSISEVIKERQRNCELNSFREDMGKETINSQGK
jgi:hypothetical protein